MNLMVAMVLVVGWAYIHEKLETKHLLSNNRSHLPATSEN